MKAATSSHELRGISFIGDLYILMGMGLIFAGIIYIFTINLMGLLIIGFGLMLGAIGHYLDDLKPWAWWGAFLGNLGTGSSMFHIISATPLELAISSVYYLGGAALTIGIFVYLLRPSVRELFFEK